LTAGIGAALIVLLAALGVTIIRLRPLIWEHLFIGLLLIGPVVVKLVSTGYRFIRYYAGNAVYVRKGPAARDPAHDRTGGRAHDGARVRQRRRAAV
jgi:hypothetical protein